MNKEIPIVLHTNLEYSFLWKATIPLLLRYAKDFKIYWITDSMGDYTLPDNFILRTYHPSTPWSYRILPVLQELDNNYIIYIQEDWLLIDYLSPEKLNTMTLIMELTGCKFLMSYACPGWGEYKDTHTSNSENMVFYKYWAHFFQPAIWKKELLEEVMATPFGLVDCEQYRCNFITSRHLCLGVQYMNCDKFRTTTSPLFPHMHAIIQGKWTFKKYPKLKEFVESFGIDTTTRGIETTWETEYE